MPVMGMWNNNGHLVRQGGARALLLLYGVFGITWMPAVMPSLRLTTPARELTDRIVADERFKPGLLAERLERLNTAPRPTILQSEFSQADALVALRVAEEAAQRKNSEEADREIKSATSKVRAALSVSPMNSFLWLMLYSAKTRQNGFDPAYFRYLNQSYATGPHEGWVALRRNGLALSAFSLVDNSTQELVVSEFAGLVDAEFTEVAALNLMGAGWMPRDRLLNALLDVEVASKKRLHSRLSSAGVKLNIPGIEYDERPWR